MKTKYLLTALALPAMFAACSQEDIIADGNYLQSTEVTGKVAGDVAFEFEPQSRLVWGATGAQAWEANDEFSLFWVSNDKDNALTSATNDGEDHLWGMANALYKKDGSTFTSENILFVGKHLMVYPVNKAHVTNQKIVVEVGETQDGNVALGNRSVYTNESLLTIDAMPENAEDMVEGVIYAAGYKQPVLASVKPLSSNLVLNLNFEMPASINEVTVKSVSLKADEEIFAPKGYLTADEDMVGFEGIEKTNKIVVKMPEGTKVTKSNKTYTAQIALLPVVDDADTYSIEVLTNYGVVTIDKAKYVTNSNGLYYSEGNTLELQNGANFEIGEAALDLDEEMALTADNSETISYRNQDVELGDAASYGKRITANVKVMMTEASIHNMEVADSQELIDAYNTYTLLAKTGDENFILKNEKPFEMTPAAVAKILSNKNITLTQKDNDTIKLVGAHTAIPSLTVKNGNSDVKLFDTSATKLLLGAEGTWTLDVDAAAAANTWGEVVNGGELTITESNPAEDVVELAVNVTNCATVTFGSDVEMNVPYAQTEDGTTTVPEDKKVDLSNGGNIAGKVVIEKNGGLYANRGIVYVQEGAEVEVAGSFLTASTANMHNLGTITLSGNGTAYVTSNADGDTMGSIVLAKRNSSAKVEDANRQGYIKWPCDLDKYETRNTDDAFNTLVLSKDLKVKEDDNVHYIEINGAKVNIYPKDGGSNLEWSLKNVVVGEGKTLVVPKGTTLSVEKTVNNGRIEVFGAYTTKVEEGSGKIYYYNGQVNVATLADFEAALVNKNASLVVLTESISLENPLTITGDKTIDLNGNSISVDKNSLNKDFGAMFVIDASGKEVTFKNGTLDASCDWTDDERVPADKAKTDNVSVYAIKVLNGTVNIESGEYITGSDKMKKSSKGELAGTPVIGAKGVATVNISGGRFEAKYPCSNGTGKFVYYPLQANKGNWNVTGGTFANYNPNVALNTTEAMGEGFNLPVLVNEGYDITYVKNVKTGKDETSARKKTQFVSAWSQGRDYTVGAVVAE